MASDFVVRIEARGRRRQAIAHVAGAALPPSRQSRTSPVMVDRQGPALAAFGMSSHRGWLFVAALAVGISLTNAARVETALAAPGGPATAAAAACAEGDRLLSGRNLDGASEKYLLARRLATSSSGSLRARDVAAAELRISNVATIRRDWVGARRHLEEGRKSAEELHGEARVALAAILDALASIDVVEKSFEMAERRLSEAVKTVDEAVPKGDPRRLVPRLSLSRFHLEHGRPSEATAVARTALGLSEAAFGPTDRRLLQVLLMVGRAEASSGDVGAADSTFERVVRIATPLDSRDPELAFALGASGMHFITRGRSERGVPLVEKAVALQEARGGGEDPSVVPLLAMLASVHQSVGRTREAGALLDRVLRILGRAGGADSPELAPFVIQRARVELAAGGPEAAGVMFRRAVRLVEGRPGGEDSLVDALIGLTEALRLNASMEDARAAIERALAIARRPDLSARPDQALRLQLIGASLLKLGDPRAARPVLEDALRAAERLGPGRVETGIVLGSLAMALLVLEEPAAAQAALRKALVIQIKNEGEIGPSVGATHSALSRALLAQGDVEGARKAVRRAVEVLAQTPDTNGSALVLADAHVELGALSPAEEAERQAELARAILVKKLGPETSQLSRVDLLLAGVAAGRGDVAGAEQLTMRALSRLEGVGPKNPDLVLPLIALAGHATNRRDLRRAFDLLERAEHVANRAPGDTPLWMVRLELAKTLTALRKYEAAAKVATSMIAEMERRLGTEHPALADPLSLLGTIEITMKNGDPEAHMRRARELRTKALGESPGTLAPFRMVEGFMLALRGKTREAEALLKQATSDYGSTPATTKEVALVETARAILAADRGDGAGAVELIEHAIEHSETDLGLALGRSTDRESDELVFARVVSHRTAVAVHLGYAPRDPRAARAAVTGVLRMKERSRESAAMAMASARRRMEPHDRELLDALALARSEAARLDVASVPPAARGAHEPRVAEAWQRVRGMERELASRGNVPRDLAVRVTLDDVRAGLAQGSALVELVVYDAWRKGNPLGDDAESRYAAYVIRPDGDPVGVDLGPVEAIDRDVTALREALGGETDGPHAAVAARLYAKLFRPLESALRGTSHVVFAPDGSLSMLPFAVLRDEAGHTLLERFGLSYVGSGRELVRRSRVPSRSGPVVVANPSFGERPAALPEGAVASRFHFGPLPGTGSEAKVLEGLLPGAAVLTGASATEAAVKAVKGPRLLHIATHGFFLGKTGDVRGTRGLTLVDSPPGSDSAEPRRRSGSAMTRSGLGFAGANVPSREGEDGVLSALEASGLDLTGTKLLVLSACQTALGDAEAGNGVYGLRRAFAIAGAETQVLSLWKVSDEVTATLMSRFYKELVGGAGRAEALRTAQLAVAANPKTAHPYYWAAFVLSGDVTTLDGAAAPAPIPHLAGRVSPSARGCACDAAGGPSEGLPMLPAAATLGILMILARRRPR